MFRLTRRILSEHPQQLEIARTLLNKLWLPFNSDTRGPDISNYDVKRAVREIAISSSTHNSTTEIPEGFSCLVNGHAGQAALLEDMFIVLLCGFDVYRIVIDPSAASASAAREAPVGTPGSAISPLASFSGSIMLHHSRSFIGWKPTNMSFAVPYKITMELTDPHSRVSAVSHLSLTARLDEPFQQAGCPVDIVDLLRHNAEALRMMVALRRVRVKPELISLNMLRSATRKSETWADALGMQ